MNINQNFNLASNFTQTQIQKSLQYLIFEKVNENKLIKKILRLDSDTLKISQQVNKTQYSCDNIFESLPQILSLNTPQITFSKSYNFQAQYKLNKGFTFFKGNQRLKEIYIRESSSFSTIQNYLNQKISVCSFSKIYKPLKKLYSQNYFSIYLGTKINDGRPVLIKSFSKQNILINIQWQKLMAYELISMKKNKYNNYSNFEIFETDVSIYFIIEAENVMNLQKKFEMISSQTLIQIVKILEILYQEILSFHENGLMGFKLNLQNILVLKNKKQIFLKIISLQNSYKKLCLKCQDDYPEFQQVYAQKICRFNCLQQQVRSTQKKKKDIKIFKSIVERLIKNKFRNQHQFAKFLKYFQQKNFSIPQNLNVQAIINPAVHPKKTQNSINKLQFFQQSYQIQMQKQKMDDSLAQTDSSSDYSLSPQLPKINRQKLFKVKRRRVFQIEQELEIIDNTELSKFAQKNIFNNEEQIKQN